MKATLVIFVTCVCSVCTALIAGEHDRSALLGGPVIEWSLQAEEVAGNRFDVIASAVFTHVESGERRRTELFHVPPDRWNFRFTPLKPGSWTFTTESAHPALHERQGTVVVAETTPTGAPPRLFVSRHGNRWAWSGSGRPFVPRLVMYRSPDGYFDQPQRVDDDLKLWFVQHGFNGLHTAVLCRWFNLDQTSSDAIESDDPNPDPRTFEALELLITKAHAAGGFVHLWAWGDESRGMTPTRWGLNGKADRRLQRYIAARLGPLPGWTMGYGFDLWEWVDGPQLVEWHDFLQQRLFHPHLIGGRVHQHGRPLDTEMTRTLSYMGYETHRPDYAIYRMAMDRNPERPVMVEDRFRVRDSANYREKDYTLDMTRRGLWHAAFAGGVANIWGYLMPAEGAHGMSNPYPNRQELKTHAEFFDHRFAVDIAPVDNLTDGLGMASTDRTRWLVYKEHTDRLQLNLASMPAALPAVAVDTRQAYREISLGVLNPAEQTWTAPYISDWAVAVGDVKP